MKIKAKIKKFLIVLTLIFIYTQLSIAQSTESTPVGPGIVHHHDFKGAGPWHINILEIDLSNQWIKLETVKANDRLAGREPTSSMATRNDRESHRVVGAINSDFYETGGIPVGAQVLNGQLLKRPTTRSVLGFTSLDKPFIEVVTFEGVVTTRRKNPINISGINEIRGKDKLVLYNKYYGSTTRTNVWGTEIIAEYLASCPVINDRFLVVVRAKDSVIENGHGNNAIPKNGMVLSGHGTTSTFMNANIFIGDTLSVLTQLSPVQDKIIELIGGTPRLIRNGVATVEWESEHCGRSFAYDRHPRTAVGFNQDSTRLYFFTVDGRQPGFSVGMSLFELADYTLEWGVYQGINLDGGGSTTMVVRGNIVNRPSDAAGERSVANAFLVISTAPTGPLSSIKIFPKKVNVVAGSKVKFSIQGFDQYYNSVTINPGSLKWNCDQKIGIIDENGLFNAGMSEDSGFVHVTYKDIRDSAQVYITKVASIEPLPNPIRLGLRENQRINLYGRESHFKIIALSPTVPVDGEIVVIYQTKK